MITRTLLAVFAAISLGSAASAVRPTSDEVALRLGVEGWFSSRQAAQADPELNISVQGASAVTAFRVADAAGSRVKLTWEKREGVWQIAREEIAPAPALTSTAR